MLTAPALAVAVPAVGPAGPDPGSLKRVLAALVDDPSAAVWEPAWCGSAAFRAACSAQLGLAADAVYAATHGSLTRSALVTGAQAAGELAGLFRRAHAERAAGVLAALRAAGLTLFVRDGQVRGGPQALVTDEHRLMVAEWRAELAGLLAAAEKRRVG